MEEGTFVEWLKRDGDPVRPGDPLFVLESEKAAEPVEAIDQGVLRLAPDSPKPGEVVKVGQVIAYLAAEGETVPEQGSVDRATEVPMPGAAMIGAEHAPQPVASPPTQTRERPAASPRARR